MKIERFIFGPFETNTYVVSLPCREGSESGSQVLLIDPACSNEWERNLLEKSVSEAVCTLSVERSVSEAVRQSNALTIIATHGHLDHLWGAKWATERWNTPVLMHEADIPIAQAMQEQYNLFGIRSKPAAFSIQPIDNTFSNLHSPFSIFNSQFSIVNCPLSILPTPGHTPGSVCLYFPEEKVLFSGDTLFQMGYGRTDLPGGNYGRLLDSLEHLFSLPSDVRVYPGHGEQTTIGREKR